jgi:hypothetical protein
MAWDLIGSGGSDTGEKTGILKKNFGFTEITKTTLEVKDICGYNSTVEY